MRKKYLPPAPLGRRCLEATKHVGAPNLCPETEKPLDLEISSPGLKKFLSSNWGGLLSPGDAALGTQTGHLSPTQDLFPTCRHC